MANEFYDPGDQRAAKVNALFTRIAPRYDLINDLQSFGLHRLWKRKLVRLARPQPGEAALDVCCGTGDIALALARRGAVVTGLDFSDRMLEVAARRKSCSAEAPSVRGSGGSGRSGKPGEPAGDPGEARAGSLRFLQGDAQQIPLADNSFAIVTVGYGLRNLASWERGLSEMMRVAQPGGRLLVLDFGKPDHPLWHKAYFAYLGLFVPLLGRVCCGSASAYAYILESLRHYPGQRGLAERMRAFGLGGVRIHNLLGGAMSIVRGEKPLAEGVV